MTGAPGGGFPANMFDFCGHDRNYATDVRYTGQQAMVLRSFTQHVHGGGNGGICEPIGHAPQVRAGGSPVIRDGDAFWMDNRKTVGEAQFVRDTASYTAPKDADLIPGSAKTLMSDAVFHPDASGLGASSSGLLQTVQASTTAPQQLPFAAPPGERPPPPAAVPQRAPTQTGPNSNLEPPQQRRPQQGPRTGSWSRWLNPFAEAEAARRFLDGWTDNRISKQGIENLQIGSLEKEVLPQLQTDEDRATVQGGIDRIRREAMPTGDRQRAVEIYDETIEKLAASEERRRRQALITPAPGGNARVSTDPKCRSETICFTRNETNNPSLPNKFDSQLKMQQDALNAKTPA